MQEPLAYKMRPVKVEDIIGQKHILQQGKLLYRMINSNRMSSIILYGPPGTGKTSLASAIAGTLDLPFTVLNAVSSGKKDMEKVVSEAEKTGQHLLFIDEIHRFNKAQQDYLLPYLEKRLVILIGATTENPYHSVNPAIRSRCSIFELKRLEGQDIIDGISRALEDKENGLGNYKVKINDDAIKHLAQACGGDLRSALNALELAVLSSEEGETIDLEIVEECIQKKNFSHDKNGDAHYDVLSAFQKSIRGSDVNAALHYLARLIKAGDLESICRRLLVIADEDIGLANTDLRTKTLSSVQIVERVGLPEALYTLSACVIELCLTPKSNSAANAMKMALEDIEDNNIGDIPDHLKDSHYKGASKLGRGLDYLYPHNYPLGWVSQQYLPNTLKDREYYTPKDNGDKETQMGKFYYWMKKQNNK